MDEWTGTAPEAPLAAGSTPSDEEIVGRVRAGERELFELLMRRHNQRVYRVVRAVLRDEDEAEDVMQQAYVNAFTHLHQFEGRSRFSTWLTRIALNEAFLRRKSIRRSTALTQPPAEFSEETREPVEGLASPHPDPEHRAYAQELHRVLEQAVDALPETYRVVFMLRDVEGLSTSETAESLGIAVDAVRTRLHRARAGIRRAVTARIGEVAVGAFQFHAIRCDRVVATVLARISTR